MTTRRRHLTWAISICGVIGLAAGLVVVTGADGNDTPKPVMDRHPVGVSAEVADLREIDVTRTVLASAAVPGFAEMARQLAAGERPRAADPIVVASLAAPDVTPPSPAAVAPMGTAGEAEPAPADQTPETIAILDECFVLDSCVDHYLWELYQRTAKQDTNRLYEWRKVKVKKKRRIVTVTQRFTRLVNEDFTWKDPDAAEKIGMPLMDYVIGGMDRDFKLKLFQTLRAAEKVGLSPGITSGFRDDYRQSIASGQKAASNRSYHGGSLRGGYGHGVAADVVSTKGATKAQRWLSTVALWAWIDANEQQYGVGRPYLGKDPPHVAPIDGEEYASRRGPKIEVAQAERPKVEKSAVDRPKAGKQAEKPKTGEKKPVRVAAKGAGPRMKQAPAAKSKSATAAKSKQAPAAGMKHAVRAEDAARNAKQKASPTRPRLAAVKRS